uniref:Uncharacterized protein n=1 Tax=Anopheles dirus TaxID=7168 RepID=A0A182NJL4_9DIPT
MSEPTPDAAKKPLKDASSKPLYSEGSAFASLGDDGFLTGPSLKSPTPAEDAIMSDDETKTLTTLEPPRKPMMLAKKSFPAAAPKPPANETQKAKESFKAPDGGEMLSKESLIQKMRSKLSKHIDLKVLNAESPDVPPLDMSGAIEIPQDLILSNDIPQTPIAAPDSKETKLDDHDLIAILEGNVVAIRENASEIEVCVGSDESKDMGEELEIVSFSIIDPDEMQLKKKEREKEIARRQMESLPLIPKVRKPRTKLIPKPTTEKAGEPMVKSPTESKATVPSAPVAGVTIKGQTTIRPIVKASAAGNLLPIKKEATEPDLTSLKAVIAKNLKEKLSKDAKPPTQQKTTQLVDSLVSDWDDEPAQPHQQQQLGLVASLQPEKKPSPAELILEPPKEPQPPSMPPPAVEQKRVIKRKIIWDPSDASIPFASLVKSNRAQSATLNPTAPGPLRRKRADSVAVHMLGDMPHISTLAPVRQRAKTPEPVKVIERVPAIKVELDSLAGDSKAKKRKKNEIERLLGDEGAINMLYDVECETNRKDLLKDTEVDTSDEDEKLLAKTKIITDVVINQHKSPNEAQSLRVRAKRASTPLNQQASGAVPAAGGGGGSGGTGQIVSKPTPSPPTTSSAGKPAATKKATNGTAVSPTAAGRKRKATASAAKEWDYVYNAQRNEDAMIIRRRSNSSYSSGASPRRLSFDQTAEPVAQKDKSPAKQTDDGFLFAKPPAKSVTTEQQQALPPKATKSPPTAPGVGGSPTEEVKFNPSLVANMRGKLSKVLKGMQGAPLATSTHGQEASTKLVRGPIKRKAATGSGGTDAVDSVASADVRTPSGLAEDVLQRQLDLLKQVTCVKSGQYMELVLHSTGVTFGEGPKCGPLTNVFSYELMNELSSTLNLLQKDVSVRAVLLRSGGAHFSRGLDVAHLVHPQQEKRKFAAEDMSTCLMKFLKTLIAFPKPIIAAVHGDLLGMGVTILPLFDMVLAQMGSSFVAPYGHFGYLPEGLGAFSTARALKPKTVTDLLLQGKRMTATAALEYGLVTETVPPERFEERARSLAKTVASHSVQAMQSIKQHLRRELVTKMEATLALEQKKHAQQWPTLECQHKFKLFVGKGGEL